MEIKEKTIDKDDHVGCSYFDQQFSGSIELLLFSPRRYERPTAAEKFLPKDFFPQDLV